MVEIKKIKLTNKMWFIAGILISTIILLITNTVVKTNAKGTLTKAHKEYALDHYCNKNETGTVDLNATKKSGNIKIPVIKIVCDQTRSTLVPKSRFLLEFDDYHVGF